MTKLLYSLAGCDSKIADEEVRTIKYILSAFDMIKSYKMVSPFAVETFQWKTLPKYLESIEIRHFIVWLMFLFANTDSKITTDEVNFIEARAEELKINKSNFLLIHGQFVKGRS